MKFRWIVIVLFVACGIAWPNLIAVYEITPSQLSGIDRQVIADAIGSATANDRYPQSVEITTQGKSYPVILEYAIDERIQEEVFSLFANYHPDYAAYVAIDAQTGKVIAMASYSNSDKEVGNLAIRTTFPAASVFKIVTAAAAIELNKITSTTIIPYNGKSSSLYKRNVLRHKNNRWTRRPTVRQAFAKSVNSVFGRIGVFQLGAENLSEFATRFGFNQSLNTDMAINGGEMTVSSEDTWNIAEVASGYTRGNTLSPIHGAMIAAAVVNEGKMVEPYIINAIYDETGMRVYTPETKIARQSISKKTATEMRKLMRETVRSGSARKSFKGFFRGHLKSAKVGGKTGSLTGFDPPGKTDWFVGYGEWRGRKVAYAALTVNEKFWTVKASYLSRKILEKLFEKPALTLTDIATNK
jgi:peptidoglycan glycosyltransferase